MKVKATVKPSRPSLIVGLIAIGFMIGFGIFFMSLIAGEEESWMGMVFLSMWLLIALLIAGAMLYNYFKKNDAPAIGGEITFTDDETMAAPTNFEVRLRQLERLHKEQLITEAEYQKKRKEIMESRW